MGVLALRQARMLDRQRSRQESMTRKTTDHIEAPNGIQDPLETKEAMKLEVTKDQATQKITEFLPGIKVAQTVLEELTET